MKRAFFFLLALGACVAGAEPPLQQMGLRADSQGLQPIGIPLRIDFSRTEESTIASVSKLLGQPPKTRQLREECGAGPVTEVSWSNGLTLNFQNGDFLGWVTRKARGTPVATTSGIAPGLSRTDLVGASFKETSLGTEFETGQIYGLIQGDKVGMVWSGMTCFFR